VDPASSPSPSSVDPSATRVWRPNPERAVHGKARFGGGSLFSSPSGTDPAMTAHGKAGSGDRRPDPVVSPSSPYSSGVDPASPVANRAARSVQGWRCEAQIQTWFGLQVFFLLFVILI
jgi:hypothetical protein